MTKYWPKIPLREGNIIRFDSIEVRILERERDDTFMVEFDDGEATTIEEWHIDQFTDYADQADTITIK